MATRQWVIWQAYCHCDPADTDSFHTDHKSAMRWCRQHERDNAEPAYGLDRTTHTTEVRAFSVKQTKGGVCEALKAEPRR